MAETNLLIVWTDRSLSDTRIIRDYLQYHFTQREIDNFYTFLESFEKIVSIFPQLYPQTNKNSGVRRAVLSKQLAVFYSLEKGVITVIAVLDNRMSDSKWP
jgi:hypothetical protein